MEGSSSVALSGTVSETARLGLPSLPGADGGASLDWQSLITGSHTALVSVAGPDKQRVALLGSLAESDVIRNGQDLWTYVSSTNAVTHTVLSGKDGAGSTAGTPDADASSLTPAGAAQKVLAAIDPSTVVTVDPTQVVAGEKAYTLVLTPRDTRSTVHKVTIAIDATHYVPLQVEVFGASSTPAFQTGFIGSVSFATPAASVFEFHAPAGATTAPDPLGVNRQHHDHGTPTPGGSASTSYLDAIVILVGREGHRDRVDVDRRTSQRPTGRIDDRAAGQAVDPGGDQRRQDHHDRAGQRADAQRRAGVPGGGQRGPA